MINVLNEERVAPMSMLFDTAALTGPEVKGIGRIVVDHSMSLSTCGLSPCAGAELSLDALR